MTHDDLVKRAERWLRNSAWRPRTYVRSGKSVVMTRETCTCAVVLAESLGSCTEQPDVIGWSRGGRVSSLIECKVSVSDFNADAKKPFRVRPKTGMGTYRYYMTPKGLVSESMLPEKWGLLEIRGRTVKVIRHPERFERQSANEMSLLWSECRKIQIVERGGELLPTKAGMRIMDAVGKSIDDTEKV